MLGANSDIAKELTARFMRQNNFVYTPQFKLVFIGNHKPEVRTVDDAMKRRAHMVPFTRKPAKVDGDLRDKLRAEWPAIFAWMIQGCLDWQMFGLTPPLLVRETTDQYFTEEDTVGRWLKECTVIDSEAGAPSSVLFASWQQWARQQGEWVGSLKRLSATLTLRGFPKWRDQGTRRHGFGGLRVLDMDGLEDVL